MTATPRLGHPPIDMRRVAGIKDIKKVGDFCWSMDEQRRRSLVIGMPYGKGVHPIAWTVGHKNPNDAQWSWDGNKEKPTLTPSLHWVGAWHGWCRAGQLVEA